MKRARGVFYDEKRREWYFMCDAPGVNGKRRQAHRVEQTERRLAIGPGWRPGDLVFCEVDGSPIHPDRLSKRWSDLVARHAGPVGVLRRSGFTTCATATSRSSSTPESGRTS